METNTHKLLRKFKALEANNDHNEAAKLLVETFGTKDDQEIIKSITAKHKKRGHILPDERDLRYEISQKYYYLLYEVNKKS